MATTTSILEVQQGPAAVWVVTAVAVTTGDESLAELLANKLQVCTGGRGGGAAGAHGGVGGGSSGDNCC